MKKLTDISMSIEKEKNFTKVLKEKELISLKILYSDLLKKDICWTLKAALFFIVIYFTSFIFMGVDIYSMIETFSARSFYSVDDTILRLFSFLNFFVIYLFYKISIKRELLFDSEIKKFKKKHKISGNLDFNLFFIIFECLIILFMFVVATIYLMSVNYSLLFVFFVSFFMYGSIGIINYILNFATNVVEKNKKNEKNKKEILKDIEMINKEIEKITTERKNNTLSIINNKSDIKSILSYYKLNDLTKEEDIGFSFIMDELKKGNKKKIEKNKKINEINNIYKEVYNENTEIEEIDIKNY